MFLKKLDLNRLKAALFYHIYFLIKGDAEHTHNQLIHIILQNLINSLIRFLADPK